MIIAKFVLAFIALSILFDNILGIDVSLTFMIWSTLGTVIAAQVALGITKGVRNAKESS